MINQLEGTKWITAANGYAEVSLNGQFASLAVEVIGTISAGNIQLKGIVTGDQTPTLYTENVNGGGALASNQIVAAGIYRCAPAALQAVRAVASGDFAATPGVQIIFSASESLPPAPLVA